MLVFIHYFNYYSFFFFLFRFGAIRQPLHLNNWKRRGRLMLAVAWSASCICSLPQASYPKSHINHLLLCLKIIFFYFQDHPLAIIQLRWRSYDVIISLINNDAFACTIWQQFNQVINGWMLITDTSIIVINQFIIDNYICITLYNIFDD